MVNDYANGKVELMPSRILKCATFLICITFASSVFAQPFGIAMGTPQELLVVKTANVKPGFHQLHSVPRPHSEFEQYYVTASHESGVCAIRASGKSYKNDPEGKKIRAAFDTLKNQLDASYGVSRTDYYIKPESILSNANVWVKSIAEYDRIHRAIWDVKSDATLKNDVSAIALLVQALANATEAYLFLEYRFSNYDDCQKETASADANAL